MVDIVEENSGPGAALYACAPCREQRGLTPVVEQAHEVAYRDYLIHTTDCAGCSRLGRCDVGGLASRHLPESPRRGSLKGHDRAQR
ncbi:hypothetical protein SBADM41S_11333 [Streptomyces badius]